MASLEGKVALVTGAGSGLGEATALALASAGASVACLDINSANAAQTCEQLQQQGRRATAIACDVSSPTQVSAAVEQVLTEWGQIDVAVSCAAVDHTVSVVDMSIEQWDQEIGVNLKGPFLIAKAVLPAMIKQRSGHIVNVSSTAATRAWANASAYHASKWGLVGFSRALGVEGRDHGIRVTTLIPGGMRTHFFDRFLEQGIPMPDMERLQDPASVAQAILFAVTAPEDSVIQEMIVTPMHETSWP